MTKVNLPGDGWAVLRDPETVTERQRRPLIKLQRRMLGSGVGERLADNDVSALDPSEALKLLRPVIGTDDFNMLDEIDDLIVAVLVESWSYGDIVSADTVLDLPSNARKALVAACKPLLPALLGETTDEDVLNPESPTAPGNGSDRQ